MNHAEHSRMERVQVVYLLRARPQRQQQPSVQPHVSISGERMWIFFILVHHVFEKQTTNLWMGTIAIDVAKPHRETDDEGAKVQEHNFGESLQHLQIFNL